MSAFRIDSDPRDGEGFDLLATLIDAESRGSKIAGEMREAIMNYDESDAEEFHSRIEDLITVTRQEILELFDGFDKEIDEELDEDEDEELSEIVNEAGNEIFESSGDSLKLETLSLILGEYYNSTQEFGAFGTAAHLADFDYLWKFGLFGLSKTPFISRSLLWDTTMGSKQIWSGKESGCWCGCTWGMGTPNVLLNIGFSPIISEPLLAEIIGEITGEGIDARWLGLPLLVNANLTLDHLITLAESAYDYRFANSYCLAPRTESKGVCGSLVEIERWSDAVDWFYGWKAEDLIGEFDEDLPDDHLVRVFSGIAKLYLSTESGSAEASRDDLGKSETFGKILIAYRMVEEFKSGRAKVAEELNSESSLVRTLLYWMPGLDPSQREKLKTAGVEDFDEQVGAVLAEAWSARPHLIA